MQLTEFEREQFRIKVLDDREVRNGIQPPPLPEWAKDGVPIPRKNTGPNVTAERIKAYKARVWREYGRRVEV